MFALAQPLAALLTAAALTAPAPPQDGSWLAWHGCWQPIGNAAAAGTIVCALPGADPLDIEFATISDGVVVDRIMMRADGAPRAVSDDGCTGTETARWSADGQRVYVRTQLECPTATRVTTGVMALLSTTERLDVRALTVFDQHVATSTRYRAVSPASLPADVQAALGRQSLQQETARMAAAVRMDVDDVIEATSLIAPPALEALLAARGDRIALDARALVRLADAKVSKSVINVLVALAYPAAFAVREAAPEPPMHGGAAGYAGPLLDRSCYDYDYGIPLAQRMLGNCYDYNSRYGFGRNNYGYGGFYGGGLYGRPIIIEVDRGDQPVQRGGQFVKGRGYAGGNPSTSSAGTVRTAQPRTTTRPTASRTGVSSGSSAGATTRATTGSTSGGTTTTRTAKARDGGG